MGSTVADLLVRNVREIGDQVALRRLHPDGAARDGSGAGLAIVRRIVERHGGHVWAAESPGGGTTMWSTFATRDRQ